MNIDQQRLFLTGGLALVVLSGATFLAYVGKLDSAAAVALYGAAIGSVGTGVRGGTGGLVPHTHPEGNGAVAG